MTHNFSFGTSALRLDETPTQAFFRALCHDDRSSFYCIARKESNGQWSESFARSDQLLGYSLFDDAADWYISRNGFSQRSRKTERLRQINALMYDLDCHQGNARLAVAEGLQALWDAVLQGNLPEPSLIVDTGRGLHVYYVMERSLAYRVRGGAFNEKGLAFFRDVEAKLLSSLKHALGAAPQLEVDTTVLDFARVGRIPGTFNVSAGRYAQLVHLREDYYSLSQLSTLCSLKPLLHAKRPGKSTLMAFDKLALSRVGKLFKLQEARGFNCQGNRELMCFCLYNAAVQVYADKEDAYRRLVEFNSRFNEPLASAVLSQIVRSVTKVGFYKMSAATIVNKLKMSSGEIESTSFFESRRMIERQEAKRATAEKRQARNEKIVALYAAPDATMESVAKAVGVCKRTVASVLKCAREAVQADISPDKPPVFDLKEAARRALNLLDSKKCNFLADVFRGVACSSPHLSSPLDAASSVVLTHGLGP